MTTENGKKPLYLVDEEQLLRMEGMLSRMKPVDPNAEQLHTSIASMFKTIRTRSRDNRLADLEWLIDEFDAEHTRIKLHLTAAGIPETERTDAVSQPRYITPAERVAMLAQRLQLAEAKRIEEGLAEPADTAEVQLVDAETQAERKVSPESPSDDAAVIELRLSDEFSRLVWMAYGLLAILILLSVAAARFSR